MCNRSLEQDIDAVKSLNWQSSHYASRRRNDWILTPRGDGKGEPIGLECIHLFVTVGDLVRGRWE